MNFPRAIRPPRKWFPIGARPKAFLVGGLDRPDRLAWLQKSMPPDVKLIAAPEGDAGPSRRLVEGAGDRRVDASILAGDNSAMLARGQEFALGAQPVRGRGRDDRQSPTGIREISSHQFGPGCRPRVASNAFAMMVALMRGMDGYVRMDVAQHMQEPDWGPKRGWQLDSPWTV